MEGGGLATEDRGGRLGNQSEIAMQNPSALAGAKFETEDLPSKMPYCCQANQASALSVDPPTYDGSKVPFSFIFISVTGHPFRSHCRPVQGA